MKTLYLRNVPDDVVRRLQTLADRDHSSLNAVAVRELSEVTRRADNRALLDALPDLGLEVDTILRSLDEERAAR